MCFIIKAPSTILGDIPGLPYLVFIKEIYKSTKVFQVTIAASLTHRLSGDKSLIKGVLNSDIDNCFLEVYEIIMQPYFEERHKILAVLSIKINVFYCKILVIRFLIFFSVNPIYS
jgi:hypothetical protein